MLTEPFALGPNIDFDQAGVQYDIDGTFKFKKRTNFKWKIVGDASGQKQAGLIS